ncbi:MAG: hypothetical protein UU83_C0043G0008 [Candidatus Jorgensenbacteria bacterium GW2011_GWF2_41_8]|nr:MAG: hypothetical protein UU83_C0043G0008 [Candidatus Jorgensenbacteria bacterium GW2011_GWF2_41_8]
MVFLTVLAAMGLGMFGFASADEATPTPTISVTPRPGLACMQTAVAKRDGAIITAFGKFSSGITTALTVRKDALVAAWGINNVKDRRAAIRAAWNAFRTSNQSARTTLKSERNSAWKQFRVDAKGCRINNIGAEGEKMGNENL